MTTVRTGLGRRLLVAGLLGLPTIFGARAAEPIVIGLALPKDATSDLLEEGASLAVKQINEAGGVGGRPLALVAERPILLRRDDLPERGEADAGRELALRLAAHRPVAVIGHDSADGAVAASQVYQNNNILFFATYAANDSLTVHWFDHVFRLIAPGRLVGKAISQYAYKRNYCRIIMFSTRHTFGRETALRFGQYAEAIGLTIPLAVSFQPEETDFQHILLRLQESDLSDLKAIDAIFFVGSSAQADVFIRQARRVGFAQPVLSLSATHSYATIPLPDKPSAEEVIRQPPEKEMDTPRWRDFSESFRTTYRRDPTEWAGLGFDAVHLVARAAEKSGSTESTKLISYLRTLAYTQPYPGVTGPIAFNLSGESLRRTVTILEYRQGQLTPTNIQRMSVTYARDSDPVAAGQCPH